MKNSYNVDRAYVQGNGIPWATDAFEASNQRLSKTPMAPSGVLVHLSMYRTYYYRKNRQREV